MKVGELKVFLKNIPDDLEIAVSNCQGILDRLDAGSVNRFDWNNFEGGSIVEELEDGEEYLEMYND